MGYLHAGADAGDPLAGALPVSDRFFCSMLTARRCPTSPPLLLRGDVKPGGINDDLPSYTVSAANGTIFEPPLRPRQGL